MQHGTRVHAGQGRHGTLHALHTARDDDVVLVEMDLYQLLVRKSAHGSKLESEREPSASMHVRFPPNSLA